MFRKVANACCTLIEQNRILTQVVKATFKKHINAYFGSLVCLKMA